MKKKKISLNIFISRLFELLQQLPTDKVVTYGLVARKLKIPSPRNIGWVLNQNTRPDIIPCYRVVLSDRKFVKGYKFGRATQQKKRLIKDGIKFTKNSKVNRNHLLTTI